MRFHIVEEPSYTEQVEMMGDVRLIDEALEAIHWGLATDPFQYEEFEGMPGTRFASTVSKVWNGITTPALRVLFRIVVGKNGKCVHLLAISEIFKR